MGRIKRGTRLDSLISLSRVRSIQVLTGLLFLYLILVSFEVPVAFKAGLGLGSESPGFESNESLVSHPSTRNDNQFSRKEQQETVFKKAHERKMGEFKVSGLIFDDDAYNSLSDDVFSELHKVAREAFALGKKALDELESGEVSIELESQTPKLAEEPCPNSVVLSQDVPVTNGNNLMMIPCGLTLGSHITVVGRPRRAHVEKNPSIALVKEKDKGVMVSQFLMELQGLRAVDGEDPPKIFHFNPRLRGDWSGRPVIEHNTCYRMQWGSAQRCEGWKSKADEDTVDGKVKCEKWNRENNSSAEESKAAWWLKRLVGRTKAVNVDWPYPFAENKLFVLTIIAGLEGFHINVDGRHVSSFPYRPGFTLEDATGFYVDGDVDIQSIVAAALPASHPSTAPKRHLEMSPKWKAPNIINGTVELFIGILSAGNHFAERMAVRKSWMQYESVRSGNVVARFFVAMHARKEVNLELMKEADYFGDIVIVPYMDNYDLVVLKTVAICEYGVNIAAAKYVMKCDDDTYVRIDAVMTEINEIQTGTSFYMGNINYYHRPLRHGKWAVTYEEYPEEVYPPYANGPGYIISSDIAEYVVSVFKKHRLRLFKMEDVSMGMWVEEYDNISSTRQAVQYIHSLKYCQFGCIEGYVTAHYQSPRQMICLWGKLQLHGKPYCCNVR